MSDWYPREIAESITDTNIEAKLGNDVILKTSGPASQSQSSHLYSIATPSTNADFSHSPSPMDRKVDTEPKRAIRYVTSTTHHPVNITDGNNSTQKQSIFPSVNLRETEDLASSTVTDIHSIKSQLAFAKKCIDEDDSKQAWFQHKRHVYIFTYSGKPVYSRYGNEDHLSAFMGMLSAVSSKMEHYFFDTKTSDTLKYMKCGNTYFSFLAMGPMHFVCVSRNTFCEMQSRGLLLMTHRQLICILTRGVETSLYNRPNFDVRPLMGGTDAVFRTLYSQYMNTMLGVIVGALLPKQLFANKTNHSKAAPTSKGTNKCYSDNEQEYFEALSLSCAFEPLPLSGTMRHVATNIIKQFNVPDILAGLLIVENRVVSISTAKGFTLKAADIVLLINFMTSSGGLRQNETWIPVCIPSFNDRAFLHAYVRYLNETLCFMCISSRGDGSQFYELSVHCNKAFALLSNSGCLAAIETSKEYCPYALPTTLWGEYKLIHSAMYLPELQQYFSSAFDEEIKSSKKSIRRILELYSSCIELIKCSHLPAHSYVETSNEKAYVWLHTEFYFFCCVPGWIEFTSSMVENLARWVREQSPFLFITETPTITYVPLS